MRSKPAQPRESLIPQRRGDIREQPRLPKHLSFARYLRPGCLSENDTHRGRITLVRLLSGRVVEADDRNPDLPFLYHSIERDERDRLVIIESVSFHAGYLENES